jgi:hypothetical protein
VAPIPPDPPAFRVTSLSFFLQNAAGNNFPIANTMPLCVTQMVTGSAAFAGFIFGEMSKKTPKISSSGSIRFMGRYLLGYEYFRYT